MPTPRSGIAAGVMNGKLYVVGGFSAGSTTGAELEAYDPISDSWSTLSLMPTPRGDLAAGVVNDKLYTAGGTFLPGQPPQATLEEYTPSGSVSVDEDYPNQKPTAFILYQNYPNPFNPSTQIQFALPKESYVRLKIYNALGQELLTLIDEQQPAGYHTTEWNGRNSVGNKVSSGVYIYRLEATNGVGQETVTSLKKLVLIK